MVVLVVVWFCLFVLLLYQYFSLVQFFSIFSVFPPDTFISVEI